MYIFAPSTSTAQVLGFFFCAHASAMISTTQLFCLNNFKKPAILSPWRIAVSSWPRRLGGLTRMSRKGSVCTSLPASSAVLLSAASACANKNATTSWRPPAAAQCSAVRSCSSLPMRWEHHQVECHTQPLWSIPKHPLKVPQKSSCSPGLHHMA